MPRSLAMLATVLVLAVAGCGGGSSSSSGGSSAATSTPSPTATPTTAASGGGGGETLKVSAPADGSLKFDPAKLTAKAGKVTIDLDNLSGTPHAVAIQGNGVAQSSSTVSNAKTSVSADLKPGTYTYFCPVDGHQAAGMEGTLTVK